MNIDDTKPTLLERLPIEIFLKIFASLPFQEIVTAFSGLNSYFDSIIRSINDGNLEVSYNDIKTAHHIHLYPIQIRRLIIIHSPNVDFTSSINLQSLTIKYGTLVQLNEIRPQHFPMLKILHICGVNGPSMIDKAKTINDLFKIILSNGFPRLRICTAIGIEPLNSNEMWTGSSSIRLLILDGQIPLVYEKLGALCPNLRQPKSSLHTPIDSRIDYMQTNISEAYFYPYKRILSEIMKIKQLESEKKFILDCCFRSGMNHTVGTVIRGRIFPKSDPYCFASFRIEIKLPVKFPFMGPDGYFLDPIYHPLVTDNGRHCCCWGFGPDEWIPTRSVVNYITSIINIIDHPNLYNGHGDCNRLHEYMNSYDSFQEKALQYVFRYGQPRF